MLGQDSDLKWGRGRTLRGRTLSIPAMDTAGLAILTLSPPGASIEMGHPV